jgi:hypothetical protein
MNSDPYNHGDREANWKTKESSTKEVEEDGTRNRKGLEAVEFDECG